MEITNDADLASTALQSQASSLLEQVTLTLVNASTALQQLQRTVVLQNQTQTAVGVIEAAVSSLEGLGQGVSEALDNATRDVPIALSEASRALAAILNISLDGLDFRSRSEEVARLENDVSTVAGLVNSSSSLLGIIRSNFSVLNTSATLTLTRSQQLNAEAGVLLNRSREALSLANNSATQGNIIIAEANRLLLELKERFSMAQNLSAGLEEVIRSVEEAERLSLLAERDAQSATAIVEQIAARVNTIVSILEEASATLSETLVVSGYWV